MDDRTQKACIRDFKNEYRIFMDRHVLLLYFCSFIVMVTGDSDGAIEGVNDELKDYLHDLSNDFFKVIMDEKLHQTYDIRVIVKPKAIQCYYQEADEKTSITAHFECLNSPSFVSSGKISASAVNIENMRNVLSHIEDKRVGTLEVNTEKPGTYGFCFDNSGSRDPATLQLVFDIWRLSEVSKFHEAQQESNNTMYHAFDGLFQVTKDVALIRAAMTHTRSSLYYDYSTRMSNLSRITNFSVLSIVLIISVCFIQLHLVKKMFGSQQTAV